MSQSPTTFEPGTSFERERSSNKTDTIVGEDGVQTVFDALHDPDSRAILDATSEAVLSATEVAEACDLPLSTTYRKLDLLTDAGLLEERTRVRSSGKHASEYVRSVEAVLISLGSLEEMDITVQMAHREPTTRANLSAPPTE